jgi:hypothetical protein
MKLRRHFLQRAHLIQSIRPRTHVLGRFGTFRYCTKVNTKLAELAPLTPKISKWSCVGIFLQRAHLIQSIRPRTHVLGRPEPFCNCTKVDAKLAELAVLTPKFAKWSGVEIFRNERTWSLHWTHNSCFRAFGNVSLLHESRYKTSWTGATNTQVR